MRFRGAAVERRVAAEAAGSARWAAALSVDEADACRASIVIAVCVLSRAIDARGSGERSLLAMRVVAVVKFDLDDLRFSWRL